MPNENVEIVRSIYERWGRGDFSASDWADPDLEFVNPEGKGGRGTGLMADRWREWLGTVEGFTVRPEEFIAVGGTEFSC